VLDVCRLTSLICLNSQLRRSIIAAMTGSDDRSEGNTPHLGVFAAFVQGERYDPFEVYLINDSEQDYARVLLNMGAFAGLDNEGMSVELSAGSGRYGSIFIRGDGRRSVVWSAP
jgi:hypothetical protein